MLRDENVLKRPINLARYPLFDSLFLTSFSHSPLVTLDTLCIARMYYWHHFCFLYDFTLHFGDADDVHVRTRLGQAFQCFTFANHVISGHFASILTPIPV